MSIEVVYEFRRSNDPRFMLTNNRSSTDALALLEVWRSGHVGRSFEVLYDEDAQDGNLTDALVARLTTTPGDVEANRGVMDALCTRFGLSREFKATYP